MKFYERGLVTVVLTLNFGRICFTYFSSSICGLPIAFVMLLNIRGKTNVEMQMLFYSEEMVYTKVSVL